MTILIIYLIMGTLNAIYSACQTLHLNHIDYPDEPFDYHLFSTITMNFFLWPITLPIWIFLKRKDFGTMTDYFEAKKKSKFLDKIEVGEIYTVSYRDGEIEEEIVASSYQDAISKFLDIGSRRNNLWHEYIKVWNAAGLEENEL